MNQAEVIANLKRLAGANPVAHALFVVWSSRTRARTTVTVGAVTQMMRAEGLKHPRGDYAKILAALGDLKLGTLIYSLRGNVAALTNVGATLQSIGAAALGNAGELTYRRYSRRVAHIMTPTAKPPKAPVKAQPKPKAEVLTPIEKVWKGSKSFDSLTIGFRVKDKVFTVEVPKGCTTQELAELVTRLQTPAKEVAS